MAREMKDSGIEWIGKIPINWNTIKLKYVATLQPSCDTLNLNENSLITYTPMEFIKTGYYVPNTITYGEVSSSLTPYNEGDIVLAKVTPCFENGNIAIMSNLYSGFGLGSSELYVIRANHINTKFLFYWLQNEAFVQMGCSTMTGTGGLKRVASSFINNCPLTVPESYEQQSIADFLDTQCAHIDSVIEKTRAAIEEYKKLKQAVITQAVTKGIRPNREMKDSGIEWIGEIPTDWHFIISRFLIEQIGDVDHYMPVSVDNGIPYVMTGDLKKFISEINFEKCKKISKSDYDSLCVKIQPSVGDVIFARYATIGTVCYVDKDEKCVISYSCVTIKPNRKQLDGKFLFYYLQSSTFFEEVYQFINSNTQGNVGIEALYRIRIPKTTLLEQSEIVAYLDEKTAAIDSLIQKKEQLITELEAYKKSLIYEYVTGKKEVV